MESDDKVLCDVADAFRQGADASRLRLLMILATGPLSTKDLAERSGLKRANVSAHLGKLKLGGLVARERLGWGALYTLTQRGKHLAALARELGA